MADYLFVPQSVLDRWSEQGRVQVEGNVLTILGERKDFSLTSAVRFMKMEAGEDISGLLQKVKTNDALKQMGAEHYLESVILGESAYQVQQGFLADANALRRAAQVSQPPPPAAQAASTGSKGPAAPPPSAVAPARKAAQVPTAQATAPQQGSAEKKGSEGDLLAQFLLDNLQ
jgi:hypothetical protein